LTADKKCNGSGDRTIVAADREAEERIGDRADSDGSPHSAAVSRYEPLDVPAWLPFWLGCLLAAFVGGVLLTISIGLPPAVQQQYRGPLKALPPAPRLESAPQLELRRYEAAKRQELRGIDAAMNETVKQGWGPPQ
jgi:hypothetical protein